MSSDTRDGAPSLDCPVPFAETQHVLLGHGSGGKLSGQLLSSLLLPCLGNEVLDRLEDSAVLEVGGARLAFTTDSYVVTPLFFPGGDIGELAVNGTVNDLAMAGARPLHLSLSLILEEGLPLEELERVLRSVRRAADRAGVRVVTGDTKVVGRGSADRLFINTSGVGLLHQGARLSSDRILPGDRVVLSGSVGDHGMAIMTRREGLELEGDLESDTAPLHELVARMLEAYPDLHALRDPTRGGVAATLVEIATRRRLSLEIEEARVPVKDAVRGACELLGLDPLMVANEGKLVAFVPEQGLGAVLEAMRSHPLGKDAVCIGTVTGAGTGRVVLRTSIGGERVLELPYGELLPRIC